MHMSMAAMYKEMKIIVEDVVHESDEALEIHAHFHFLCLTCSFSAGHVAESLML